MQFLNGYKTWLGLVLTGIGSALELAGLSGIGSPVKDIGGVVAGVGGLHKMVKRS